MPWTTLVHFFTTNASSLWLGVIAAVFPFSLISWMGSTSVRRPSDSVVDGAENAVSSSTCSMILFPSSSTSWGNWLAVAMDICKDGLACGWYNLFFIRKKSSLLDVGHNILPKSLDRVNYNVSVDKIVTHSGIADRSLLRRPHLSVPNPDGMPMRLPYASETWPWFPCRR